MSKNTFVLNQHNSVANTFIAEIRDQNIQKDRLRFRRNMERLGELFAYEISKTLTYKESLVETPLGTAKELVYDDKIVLATILRAGLPFHQGLLNYFDQAENAFVSAYRKHHKDGTFEIEMEYQSCPNLEETTLILADPMLATGASMHVTLDALKRNGTPKTIHIVTAISSITGLDYVKRLHPNAHFWIGALDEELTAKSYIVPGLGDAGDLAYGSKLQE